METRDDLLRPPPPSMAATPYERQQEDARNMEAYNRTVAERAEDRRKAEARAETEELARTRLQEFLDAGLSETELRQQWPMILSEHFGRKNAERDAERQRLVNAQRVF